MERKAMTTAEWIAYKKREIQRNKDIHCPYVAARHQRELEDFLREQGQINDFITQQVEEYE